MSSYDPEEDSTFVLSNSDIQISDDYLPESAYISEIENPEWQPENDTEDIPDGIVAHATVGDPMVYLTQKWLNQEYGDVPGFGSVPENGKTGWDTIYGLTRALQIELGITSLANNFGPTTQRLYAQNPLHRQDGVTNKKFAILQGALWCKGYSPGYYLRENADGTVSFDEIFNENVEKAVIQLKKDAGFIDPDACLMPNGQIETAYCFGEKLDESVNGKPYGRLDLIQKTADDFCDIYVNPITIYSGDIRASEGIEFYTNIYNNGSVDIDQFTAKVTDINGVVIQSKIIDCDLPVGTQTELEIPFTLPSNIAKTDYFIQIYPVNQTDIDLSNNSSTVTIGNADIVIENIQESRTSESRILSVTVKNNGYSTIDSASLKFFKDGAEGLLLTTKPIGALLPGDEKSYTLSIPNNELSSAISEQPRSYYLLLETNTVEANIGNNSKTVYVYPDFNVNITSGTGGTVSGAGTYAKGTVVTLVATPNAGYVFDGWYEDGQRLYEISEEYTVSVNSNHSLEARFKKNDLQITGIETFGSSTIGNTITFTASASRGCQPWQWEFYVKKNNTTVYSDNESAVNFFDWTPQEAGTYNVIAYVTDVTGRRVSYSISIIIT